MVSVEALSSSNDKATSIGASKRAANRVPAIDVFPSCRAGANVGLDQSIDVCLAAETSARDHLARDWDQFSQTDRSSCVRVATLGGGGSYTALLSCIEMKQYARDLPKENASVLAAGK